MLLFIENDCFFKIAVLCLVFAFLSQSLCVCVFVPWAILIVQRLSGFCPELYTLPTVKYHDSPS